MNGSKFDDHRKADERSHRVIASLNRDQVDFLDKIGKDAQFSSGLKLSRTQILGAMVNAMRKLQLDGDGVQSSDEFEQRIIDAIRSAQAQVRQDDNRNQGNKL